MWQAAEDERDPSAVLVAVLVTLRGRLKNGRSRALCWIFFMKGSNRVKTQRAVRMWFRWIDRETRGPKPLRIVSRSTQLPVSLRTPPSHAPKPPQTYPYYALAKPSRPPNAVASTSLPRVFPPPTSRPPQPLLPP